MWTRRPEGEAQPIFGRAGVHILDRLRLGSARLLRLADQRFGLANRERTGNDVAREAQLDRLVANPEQGARVSHRQRARREVRAHFLWQAQEPHVVGDRRTILPDGVGNLLLCEMEVVGETTIGLRLFDRIEILALDVLDQRDRQQLIFGNVANDNRYFQEAGALRCPPATFAGHDLVVAIDAPDDDRLDDPVGANGAGEILDPLVVHLRAGLELVGPQQIGVDLQRAIGSSRRGSPE